MNQKDHTWALYSFLSENKGSIKIWTNEKKNMPNHKYFSYYNAFVVPKIWSHGICFVLTPERTFLFLLFYSYYYWGNLDCCLYFLFVSAFYFTSVLWYGHQRQAWVMLLVWICCIASEKVVEALLSPNYWGTTGSERSCHFKNTSHFCLGHFALYFAHPYLQYWSFMVRGQQSYVIASANWYPAEALKPAVQMETRHKFIILSPLVLR